MSRLELAAVVLLFYFAAVDALILQGFVRLSSRSRTSLNAVTGGAISTDSKGNEVVTLRVPLGKKVNGEGVDGEGVEASFRPLFASSEFFLVKYKVPFSLNIERPPKNFPCPIVSKDGPEGEKVGDVLRATTCFSQGFQAAGLTSDIASFAGNIKTRPAIFDTTGAQWDAVVSALVSNTEERTDAVTLVFERDTDTSA